MTSKLAVALVGFLLMFFVAMPTWFMLLYNILKFMNAATWLWLLYWGYILTMILGVICAQIAAPAKTD